MFQLPVQQCTKSVQSRSVPIWYRVRLYVATALRYYFQIYTRCSIGSRIGKCCSIQIKVKSCILVSTLLCPRRGSKRPPPAVCYELFLSYADTTDIFCVSVPKHQRHFLTYYTPLYPWQVRFVMSWNISDNTDKPTRYCCGWWKLGDCL